MSLRDEVIKELERLSPTCDVSTLRVLFSRLCNGIEYHEESARRARESYDQIRLEQLKENEKPKEVEDVTTEVIEEPINSWTALGDNRTEEFKAGAKALCDVARNLCHSYKKDKSAFRLLYDLDLATRL